MGSGAGCFGKVNLHANLDAIVRNSLPRDQQRSKRCQKRSANGPWRIIPAIRTGIMRRSLSVQPRWLRVFELRCIKYRGEPTPNEGTKELCREFKRGFKENLQKCF